MNSYNNFEVYYLKIENQKYEFRFKVLKD